MKLYRFNKVGKFGEIRDVIKFAYIPTYVISSCGQMGVWIWLEKYISVQQVDMRDTMFATFDYQYLEYWKEIKRIEIENVE